MHAAAPPCPRRPFFIALLVLLASTSIVAQTGPTTVIPKSAQRVREVPVFWLLGQSNCAGGRNGFWLSNPYQPGNLWPQLASQTFTKIWWPGPSPQRPNSTPGWESYRTGQLSPTDNANFHLTEFNFGPEASFGDAASRALGEAVYLFKYVAVARLHPDAPTTFSRLPDRESLFDDIVREWQRASAALREQGFVPRIRGVCWIQGESDLGPSYAPHYGEHLTRFVGDIREAIARINPDNGTVRFVIARMHDRHVPAAIFDNSEALLRAAQAQVARTLPDVVITDTDDLPLDPASPNFVHFDAVGDVLLGFRMFASWADREEPSRR